VAFSLGFWHPFGPHGEETPDDIINRKRSEIANNGWTLWSFQSRPYETLAEWRRLIAESKPPEVLVFCSLSPKAADPSAVGKPKQIIPCSQYSLVDGARKWQPMPDTVRVPHPFLGERNEASAFVVSGIIEARNNAPAAAEWYSKSGEWRADRVPTRGEYLIRAGGEIPLRPASVVLVLKEPYLAVVRA
jgi:hypothetical protein